MRRLLLICAGLTVLPMTALAAPAPLPPPVVPFDAGPEAFAARLTVDGPRNQVLNQMEIGARSFWKGDYAAAKLALDDAILRIDSVFADNAAAAQSRKLWYDEGSKEFKGEPYERAMVFFYRGLLFLHDADYENARAAFRRGQMQDAFAEEQQNRSDFALLVYLDAWASHLNGDDDLRDEAMEMLARLRPDHPAIGPTDDTLILAETGFSPRKLGDGVEHSFFVYRRGKNIPENQLDIIGAGPEPRRAFALEDIYFQASTRGGRAVDKILHGKAEFKANTGTIGNVLANGSMALSDFSGASDAVAVAGGVAGVFLIVSSNAKPQADVRSWSSLPDTVHVLTLATMGKAPNLTARFLKDGVPVEGLEKPIRCEIDSYQHQLCLVRAH